MQPYAGTERDLARAQRCFHRRHSPTPGRGAKLRRMIVRVDKQGPVTTVILSRPSAAERGVDPETARPRGRAFRAFEADGTRASAVLWGNDAPSARGAIVKRSPAGKYDHLARECEWADGPRRDFCWTNRHRRIAGYASPGGLDAGALCDLMVSPRTLRSGCFCSVGPFRLSTAQPSAAAADRLSAALDLILTSVRWIRSPSRIAGQNRLPMARLYRFQYVVESAGSSA